MLYALHYFIEIFHICKIKWNIIATYISSNFKRKILACIPLAWYKPIERLQDEKTRKM